MQLAKNDLIWTFCLSISQQFKVEYTCTAKDFNLYQLTLQAFFSKLYFRVEQHYKIHISGTHENSIIIFFNILTSNYYLSPRMKNVQN